MSITSSIVFATFALNLSAHAQTVPMFRDGNDVYAMCERSGGDDSAVGSLKKTYCLAYIAGAADMLSFTELISTRAGIAQVICQPARRTEGQMRDLVLAYLRNYPERRSEPAAQMVAAAADAVRKCP